MNLVQSKYLEKSGSVIMSENKNIEEMHYHFVEFYQKTRLMLHRIECTTLGEETDEGQRTSRQVVILDEVSIE